MKKINAHYTPEPLAVEYTRYADPKTICHGQIVGDCLKGDLNSEKEVLVLGDSHAAMLNHFFDYLGKELHFKARIITASSCVTIPGFDYERLPEWAQKACLNQIEVVKKFLPAAQNIFVAASWSWHLQNKSFKQSLDKFLNEMDNKEVIIMLQEPLLMNNPIRTNKFNFIGLAASAPMDYEFEQANKYLQNYQSARNIRLIEPNRLEVFNGAPTYKGEMLYFDNHHLNQIGALRYAQAAKQEMHKIINNVQ